MKEGRFDEAAGIYRELLKGMPEDPGLLTNLGMALAMGGHESDAIAPLERAIAINPKLFPAQLFLGSSYLALGQPQRAIEPLKRVAAAQPGDVEHHRMLGQAYAESGRPADAAAALRRVTELAPGLPEGWFALGHAYDAVTQDAMATFAEARGVAAWQELLTADALLSDGRLTDAFAVYRSVLAQLPSMVSIHDSIARIYEQDGHADWAATERARGVLTAAACVKRKALCEFRAGRYRTALTAALAANDAESRYWRARAATELALAAFKRLDALPDSRQRREVRATLARADRRYTEAIAELKAALSFAPGDPGLLDDLGTSYFFARDYEQAAATLGPLVKRHPTDSRLLTVYGDSLVQMQKLDEGVAALRRAIQHDPANAVARQTLGRAYVQQGDFASAIPLLETQLSDDQDGSVHVQLARAYTGAGQREKAEALLARAKQLQESAQQRAAATAERRITPPK